MIEFAQQLILDECMLRTTYIPRKLEMTETSIHALKVKTIFFSFQLKCEKENKQRHCLCSPPKFLTFILSQQSFIFKNFTHLRLVYTL